jgi:hypothetical protein
LVVRRCAPRALRAEGAAGLREAAGGEAGASVGQHVGQAEGEGRRGLAQERGGARLGHVLLDREVDGARAAIDGDVEVPLAELAAADVQLGQLLDIDVDEPEVVVAELALALLPTLVGVEGRQVREAVQALGPQDAPDAVPVQGRQEVLKREGQVVEGEAGGAADRADDGALFPGSSPVARRGSLCGRAEWSRQSCGPRLRHFRMVSVLAPKRAASTPVGSFERAISTRTAGVVRAQGWICGMRPSVAT